MGYVSFYCENKFNLGIPCGDFNYGVSMDPATGKLSGHAYGDNTGTIAFNTGLSQVTVDVYPGPDPANPTNPCYGLVYGTDLSVTKPGCSKHTPVDSYAWSDNLQWFNLDGMKLQLKALDDCIKLNICPKPPVCTIGVDCPICSSIITTNCTPPVCTIGDPSCSPCTSTITNCLVPCTTVGSCPSGAGTGGYVNVTLVDDPTPLNKLTSKVADGNGAYNIMVTITDSTGTKPFPIDNLKVEVMPFWDDTVRKDETVPKSVLGTFSNSNCLQTEGAVQKSCGPMYYAPIGSSIYWGDDVTSIAPTSNMNGPSNAQGYVTSSYEDFYLPSSKSLSIQKNDLKLKGAFVAVKDAAGQCYFGAAPNCDRIFIGLNYDLKFAPQTEVTALDANGKTYIQADINNPVKFNRIAAGIGQIIFQSGIEAGTPYSTSLDFRIGEGSGILDWNTLSKTFATTSGILPFEGNVILLQGDPPSQFVPGLYVYSSVNETNKGSFVKYYSNKLPRVTGSYAVQPIAILQGNVYSKGAKQTVQTVQPVRSMGDVASNVLRSTIYENVLHITTCSDINSATVATTQCDAEPRGDVTLSNDSANPNALLVKSGSASKLSYDTAGNPTVYYATNGNVTLSDSSGKLSWKGERTIIVKDGNVFIDSDIGDDSTPQLGIIVLKTNPADRTVGNVYLNNKVLHVHANLFADGSLFSYVPGMNFVKGEPQYVSVDAQKAALECCQLLWKGSIASRNTVGGSNREPKLLGDGTTTTDLLEAHLYDLNYLRQYIGAVNRDPITNNALHSDNVTVASDVKGDVNYLRVAKADGSPWSEYEMENNLPGDLIPPWEIIPAYFMTAFNGTDAQSLNDAKVKLGSTYIYFVPPSRTLPGFVYSPPGS